LAESFRKLVTHRLAAIAVFAMAVGQGVMVAVMTVTPLHMDEGAHETRVIGLVISLHIVGMYFFSPLVGWLVDRLPVVLMVGAAGVILFLGAEMASHTDPEDSLGVFVGLLLVGIGWSFAMISGSALLTSAFSASERASVQGAGRLHDGRQRRNRRAAFRRDRRGQQLSRTQPLGGRAGALARRRCAVPGGHHDQTRKTAAT
jgi:MFS family permease